MTEQEYWDKKIISWEQQRYSPRTYLSPNSWGLRSRMYHCVRQLQKIAQNTSISITDIGCGSGILGERIRHVSNVTYTGYDISNIAIDTAKSRNLGSRFQFVQKDLLSLRNIHSDVTVLLGVTDWITPEQLQVLLQNIHSPEVIISYTEKSDGIANSLYDLYRSQYDKKTAHRARSYIKTQFEEILALQNWIIHKDLSSRWMQPGRLLWLKQHTSRR